jgi:4-amino-4-deoxy-L-arabinose transferase-like glycosyltransferase
MSRPVLAAAVLITVMSLLRAYAAFHFPLTADETYYWSWSLHPWMGYTDHPPMVAWLITLGAQFGHTYGFVRLPFIITEAIASIAVGFAAATLTNDTRAGAFAAIAFTLVPQTKLEFAESIPDGAYMCAWALALWAAAALARRASWASAVALGLALAATIYSRTFGFALVCGVFAWAITARRDLLRYVAASVAIALVAYIPFVLWNASVGWENFAFTFVRRQHIGFSAAKVIDISTLRFMFYGGLIIALTWFVALRRRPYLPLVAWTAVPLPLALFVLSFAMRTESYWIIGPAASLAIGIGAVLARTTAIARGLTFGVLGLSTAYAVFAALFLAMPEEAQAAAFHAHPNWRPALSSGVYAYSQLADDLRAEVAREPAAIYTDRYETSAELLWYGVPSMMVVPSAQVPQWTRWYRFPEVPERALLVTFRAPFGDAVDLEQHVRAAYIRVTPLQRLDLMYAGELEGTFYVTKLEAPTPAARTLLAGL